MQACDWGGGVAGASTGERSNSLKAKPSASRVKKDNTVTWEPEEEGRAIREEDWFGREAAAVHGGALLSCGTHLLGVPTAACRGVGAGGRGRRQARAFPIRPFSMARPAPRLALPQRGLQALGNQRVGSGRPVRVTTLTEHQVVQLARWGRRW